MSQVNLGDFDASLLPNDQFVLHRVYRYGADSGDLTLRVAPVAPEIRVRSKQVLSLGDERVVGEFRMIAANSCRLVSARLIPSTTTSMTR